MPSGKILTAVSQNRKYSSSPFYHGEQHYITNRKKTGQQSQNVESSHVKQETNTTEDTQAVRPSHRRDGDPNVSFGSNVVGTDWKVLTFDQCDWVEGDCQDGVFLGFPFFLSFSCLTVSPSRLDSSDTLWMKERAAPTTGSG